MPTKSDLPFGSEFSPSQIDLGVVLEFAKIHDGDWRAFEASLGFTTVASGRREHAAQLASPGLSVPHRALAKGPSPGKHRPR